MINLGDGLIHIGPGDSFPHCCPKCHNSFTRTERQVLTCPFCQHQGSAEFFEGIWEQMEIN